MHLKKDILDYINNDEKLISIYSSEILSLQTDNKSAIIYVINMKIYTK